MPRYCVTWVSADGPHSAGPELAELEKQGITGYLLDVGYRTSATNAAEASQEALEAAWTGKPLRDVQWAALPHGRGGTLDHTAFTYGKERDAYCCLAGR